MVFPTGTGAGHRHLHRGQIVEHYSDGPLFFIMSLLPPISYVVIRLILRKAPALEPQAKPVLE